MALFNAGYPATYQNPYMIQQPQYQPQQQQGNGSLIWVQGEAAAKSYLVAPNTSIALWDSERQSVYIKSADASGMPTMKVLDYTIRDAQQTQPQPVSVSYATKEDLSAVYAQIESIRSKVDGMTEGRKKDE